jgi:hypothetical protein
MLPSGFCSASVMDWPRRRLRVADRDKLAACGAVIGKAMGNLDSGSGTIPVLYQIGKVLR